MGSRLENNSTAVRKRIDNHSFDNEEGEEYEPSKFGGFPEYFRRKKLKLQNLDSQLREEHHGKPQLFRGIVAHVNGYTQPSLNDLHRIIVTHGGGFLQYLDGKTQVTHIIASSLTPKKVEEFRKYRIVKPAWIVDSVAEGKLLSWENYRVVDEGTKQKLLKFDDGHITSQVNRKLLGYRDQTDASWYTRQLAQDDESYSEQGSNSKAPDLDFPSSAILSVTNAGRSNDSTASAFKEVTPPQQSPDDSLFLAEVVNAGDQEHGGPSAASDAPSSPNRSPPSTPHPELMEDERRLGTGGVGHPLTKPVSVALKLVESPSEQVHAVEDGVHTRQHISTESLRQRGNKAKMTAEDHNRELLSDPRIRKSSVLNPDFLEQYYRESRLHHLSTWKADLKAQLQALTSEKSASQRARQKRAPNLRRYVLHVDFDSFFVAVSLKKLPHLQDKPAAVAHGAGSGSEIASCNYAARKFGVKNGMWMKRAQEMCDDLKVLPYDFPAYEATSKLFYDAIMETGGIVQSVSIDEALVDVSIDCHHAGGTDGTGVHEGSIWREQARADDIAQALRDRVKRESGCAVSVGIGGNVLLAKVALRRAKPAGQYHIKTDEVLSFLGELEVQSLPGVAYSIGGKLEDVGVKFVKDIRELNRERLTTILGPKTGEKIWNYSRGIDRTEVGDQVIRKSVSAEVNWGVRFETQEQAEEFLTSLSGELGRRLLKEGVKGKNLTMKIMRRAGDAPLDPPKFLGHGKCDIYNKSVVLGVLTNDKDMISKETLSILRAFGFSPGELRGLGIQMTKLEPIKAPVAGKNDGIQRRLQFNIVPATTKAPAANARRFDREKAEIQAVAKDREAEEVPTELFKPGSQYQMRTDTIRRVGQTEAPADDIQDDPETPKHRDTQRIGGIAHMVEDSPSRKPLNISGTQFILPSQVDPKVLAELPADIRAKLSKQVNQGHNQRAPSRPKQPQAVTSSGRPFAFTALPNESQIDPEILAALPEDVRKEILSQYQKSPSKPQAQRGQVVLPQSPRKNRVVKPGPASRGKTRGRPRGGSLLARLRGASSRGDPTLTQANFVAVQTDSESDAAPANIAPDFLDALPEDVRAEVVEAHKREQMRRNAGIEVARRRRRLQQGRRGQQVQQVGERVLRLELGSPRPTFTQQRLSKMDELREAIRSWYEEFESEGPYQEDVEALCNYLKSVVVDEGDMRKAVEVVRWLVHVAEPFSEMAGDQAEAFATPQGNAWASAAEGVKRAVNEAVRSRGLGDVDFDD